MLEARYRKQTANNLPILKIQRKLKMPTFNARMYRIQKGIKIFAKKVIFSRFERYSEWRKRSIVSIYNDLYGKNEAIIYFEDRLCFDLTWLGN